MEIKKAKNAKWLKSLQYFFTIFGYFTGHSGTKIYLIGRNIIIYQCFFYKFCRIFFL